MDIQVLDSLKIGSVGSMSLVNTLDCRYLWLHLWMMIDEIGNAPVVPKRWCCLNMGERCSLGDRMYQLYQLVLILQSTESKLQHS